MSKTIHTTQQYWNDRSSLFGNYYVAPTFFDRVFRKGIYTRVAVATGVCQEFPESSVLDIGSGPGVNSVTFIKNSSARGITGIDFSPNMIDYARKFSSAQNVADKCSFIEGNFLVHDWNNEKFDISVALGVLDYIEEAEFFLSRMYALTNKVIVVSWPENGLRMALRRYRYTCPLFHYSEEDIRNLHSKLGISELKLVKSDGGWVSIGYR